MATNTGRKTVSRKPLSVMSFNAKIKTVCCALGIFAIAISINGCFTSTDPLVFVVLSFMGGITMALGIFATFKDE